MEYLVKYEQKTISKEDRCTIIQADNEQEALEKMNSTFKDIEIVECSEIDNNFLLDLYEFVFHALVLCENPVGNTFKIFGVNPKLIEYLKLKNFSNSQYHEDIREVIPNTLSYWDGNTFKIGGNSIELYPIINMNSI